MPYCQLFYHMTWATKHREPLLTPEIEPIIHTLLRVKAVGLGATVYAINGVVDHVHLVASIPPKLAVATFIGQIKAVASVKLNKSAAGNGSFYWQDEYGVFTLDGKRLPNLISYVEHQKEHHAQNTTIRVLERCDEIAGGIVREVSPTYAYEDESWRKEMEEID